jgi:hypothetical protein
MQLQYKKKKPGQKNRFSSGEVGQQVAGQEGVAGGANLKRRSAQEVSAKNILHSREENGRFTVETAGLFRLGKLLTLISHP